jgi:hypothetical protein
MHSAPRVPYGMHTAVATAAQHASCVQTYTTAAVVSTHSFFFCFSRLGCCQAELAFCAASCCCCCCVVSCCCLCLLCCCCCCCPSARVSGAPLPAHVRQGRMQSVQQDKMLNSKQTQAALKTAHCSSRLP